RCASATARWTFAWTSGAGTTASAPTPTHTCVSSATYSVTVTATDSSTGTTQGPASTTVQVAASSGLGTVALTAGSASFGQALPRGLAFGGLQVGSLATQTDVKVRWDDGSIRFAVLTAQVPATGTYPLTATGSASVPHAGSPPPPAAPAPLHYDFGTPSSPVAAGYVGVSEANWLGQGQSYGWISGTLTSRDRTDGSSNLTRDFVCSPDETFAVE